MGQISDASVKEIAVNKFKNDETLGFKHILENQMNNHIINNEPFFKIVQRGEELQKILDEQKLQDEGLTKQKTQKFNGLENISAILNGEIKTIKKTKVFYNIQEKNYDKCLQYDPKNHKQCLVYETKTIRCQKQNFILSIALDITKIENAKTIYSDLLTQKENINSCYPELDLVDDKEIYINLASQIADYIIKKISPYYVDSDIKIIDELDIKTSKENELAFENIIELIKNQRYEKAKELLENLNINLGSKSIAVIYNLALVNEALSKLETALELLSKAENLALSSNAKFIEQISSNYTRVSNDLKEQRKIEQAYK